MIFHYMFSLFNEVPVCGLAAWGYFLNNVSKNLPVDLVNHKVCRNLRLLFPTLMLGLCLIVQRFSLRGVRLCFQDRLSRGQGPYQEYITDWGPGTSLVVQWVIRHLPVQGVQVQSLVRELRSQFLMAKKNKIWNRNNIAANSIKTLKMICIKKNLKKNRASTYNFNVHLNTRETWMWIWIAFSPWVQKTNSGNS